MLGEPRKLRIWSHPGKDLGVACSDHVATFALERSRDHGRTAALSACIDNRVYEYHKLIGEMNNYPLAHLRQCLNGG
jgi:hypothetical protein